MRVDLDRIRRQVMSNAEVEAVAEELRRFRMRFEEERVEKCEKTKSTQTFAPYQTLVSIGRVSTNRGHLWQSKLNHQHMIRLTVSCAYESCRDGHSHLMDGPEIVEVYMSEMQFAQMITSMNMGNGTPATMTAMCGFSIQQPGIPEDDSVEHKREIDRMSHKSLEDLRKIHEIVKIWVDGGKRPTLKEISSLFQMLDLEVGRIPQNFQFVETLLQQRVEERVAQAKAEVSTHLNSVVAKLGLKSLEQLTLIVKRSEEFVLDDPKKITDQTDGT